MTVEHPSPEADDTQPFFWRAGPAACLLLHGFTGTPEEMRFLGQELHARGFTVHGVRLAGHATSPDDLERSTWADWYVSARRGAAALGSHAPYVVVGQSMGALLALQLAVDEPDAVAGVALLSPALRLANPWLRRVQPVLPLLSRQLRYVHKSGRDVADPHARVHSPTYAQLPLRAVHQLLVLQRRVEKLLPRVRQPALVIHARHDHTCPVSNVGILERALRGRLRALVLEHSYHVISIDVEKERVAAEVAAFAAETAPRYAPAVRDPQPPRP
jgi:carboxylesterase